MSNNKPTNEQQLVGAFKDFLENQKRTHQLQQKELEIQREQIASNEKIALASIEAQKGDRVEQMNLLAKIEGKKHNTIWVITVAVVLVILVSIWRKETGFALEVLKIGGALLAGYFAGVNKGKASALEKQQHKNDE